MSVLSGPFAIAAAVLVVAGVLKVVRPADTATALRGMGVPAPAWTVRVVAALEAVIGGYALVAGDRLGAVLLACSYGAFCGFVAVALARRLPIATCGCFGGVDTPPSVLHLVLDGAALAAAVGVALDPGSGIAAVVDDQPLAGVPYLLLLVIGAYAVVTALAVLPRLRVLTGPPARRAR